MELIERVLRGDDFAADPQTPESEATASALFCLWLVCLTLILYHRYCLYIFDSPNCNENRNCKNHE